MRLVSYATDGSPRWGAVVDGGIVDGHAATGKRSLLAFLRAGGGAFAGDPTVAIADVDLLRPVLWPEKIVCIGVNYARRDEEYEDSTVSTYPSVFTRAADSLVGHGAPILRPPESEQLDYEGEVVIVVGAEGRRIPESEAEGYIAGLTIMNDGSIRDWLRHSKFNVTQGKNFTASGSLGPWIVTADEFDGYADLAITTRVNGEVRQHDTTARLIFPFATLISYLSTFYTLKPGDIIATGTPSGAGARLDPPIWLVPGDVVEVEVPGIGVLRNVVEDEIA